MHTRLVHLHITSTDYSCYLYERALPEAVTIFLHIRDLRLRSVNLPFMPMVFTEGVNHRR